MPKLQGKSQPGRVRAPRECPGCLPVHTMEALPSWNLPALNSPRALRDLGPCISISLSHKQAAPEHN